jgi:DNA polymerase elongation subunit (family B)
MLGYAWQRYDTSLLHVVKDWELMSIAWKWLDEKKTAVLSRRVVTESELAEVAHGLLDHADIVVAHNGDRFDVKKLQAKIKQYGLQPPSPFKTVDTLKIVRNHFAFSGNKLADLANTLGLANKMETEGFKLWLKCMAGDAKAWKTMEEYNKQDIAVLEQLYIELRPWMPRHPNLAVFNASGRPVCGSCGSHHLKINKTYPTNTGTYTLYKCSACGGYTRSRKAVYKNTTTIVADRR